MAKKSETTKVTRITAADESKPANKKKATTKTSSKVSQSTARKSNKSQSAKSGRSWGVLGKIGGYFKGAWSELRQVHWPTRRATWGLTGAVLLFAAFFVVFITLLDAGFKFLFEQILK